jgi:hypothetical protein
VSYCNIHVVSGFVMQISNECKKKKRNISHLVAMFPTFTKYLAWLLAQIIHEQAAVWLGTNMINKYSVFIEEKAGISWEVCSHARDHEWEAGIINECYSGVNTYFMVFISMLWLLKFKNIPKNALYYNIKFLQLKEQKTNHVLTLFCRLSSGSVHHYMYIINR